MRPDALCGLLAEPDRLSVFAAVVLGASVPSEVASAAGQPARTVTTWKEGPPVNASRSKGGPY